MIDYIIIQFWRCGPRSRLTTSLSNWRLPRPTTHRCSLNGIHLLTFPLLRKIKSKQIFFLPKKGKDSKQGQNNKETRTCFAFQKTGKCSKAGCQYLHSSEASSQPEAKRATQSPGAATQSSGAATQTPTQQSPGQCSRCGEQHPRKTCKFTGKCSWCQKEGHKEAVCKQRVAGKPKLMMSVVGGEDGVEARANLFTVEDTAAQANTCLSLKVSPSSPPKKPRQHGGREILG